MTLDTPVSKFLPQFSNPVVLQYPFKVDKPAFKPLSEDKRVTVMNILNHSSGLYYELKVPEPWYAMPVGYTGSHDKSNSLGGFLNKIRVGFSYDSIDDI